MFASFYENFIVVRRCFVSLRLIDKYSLNFTLVLNSSGELEKLDISYFPIQLVFKKVRCVVLTTNVHV